MPLIVAGSGISGSNPGIGSNLVFGNLALPNGQGTQPWIGLNDLAGASGSWSFIAYNTDSTHRLLSVGQRTYRSQGVWLADDFSARAISLTMRYRENVQPLGAAIAQLMQAGEQYLSFDAGQTGFVGKLNDVLQRQMLTKFAPLYWSLSLSFLARNPWVTDILPTTPSGSPWSLSSGTATTFSIVYPGTALTYPTFTLQIPNTNPAPIQSFALSNTMSGETLTITFPGYLAASTTWTLTIDCSAMTVTDQNGTQYDVSGSFPTLYPPASQSNPFSATLTPASGTATACTIAATYKSLWEI